MSSHWFIIESLDDLAGYFSAKAREMNEIAQKRTGLAKHHYAGQAHAFNDCAVMIRSTKFAKKKKRADTTPPVPNIAERT